MVFKIDVSRYKR